MPSTGKLYHHKMKLRRLKETSTVEEQLKYLRKRHPLYFDIRKISEEQIVDLLQRLIFRMRYNKEMADGDELENEQVDGGDKEAPAELG